MAHAASPQACPAAQGVAFAGSYTSTQMASVFGLDQLFAQGRTGIGQSIAVVEFENYLPSDFASFGSCYGLSNPIHNVVVDGGPTGPPQGSGEAALDTELAAVNAPSASIAVYEAPNGNDAQAFDLFNRIASDDSSQIVTTSWGNCEADITPGDLQTENGIFQRMALQGQTVIAASGDSGSEDCYDTAIGDTNTALAVDDPGAQPDVVSAGGTSLPSPSASAQSVWNDCLVSGVNVSGCAIGNNGAGGGGYSLEWPAHAGQPAAAGETKPCGLSACRAVPDLSYPSDPAAGSVAAFYAGSWRAFGGTSVAAPTNAGLFADTNQGCFNPLGHVGPALYAAQQANTATFTDITAGNNDLTDTNGGLFPAAAGFDAASGLGTPVDQNLAIALQGANGCPSVAGVSPRYGSGQRGWGHHDLRGWLRQRHLGLLRVGGRRPRRLSVRDLRSPSFRRMRRPPRASTSRWRTRRVSRCRPAPTATASAGTSTVVRATGSWPRTAASSTSVTPASGGARAASI